MEEKESNKKELNKEAKQRYFQKVYDEAPLVECACGCKKLIKSKDRYGRDKKYINGHNGRKYDDPTQYKREWNHRNKEKRQAYKYQYIKEKRKRLVDSLGGKCIKCGIVHDGNNTAIFDIHHKDPNEKEFNLNANTINRVSFDKIIDEAKKCDLLCSNCHRLIHWYSE